MTTKASIEIDMPASALTAAELDWPDDGSGDAAPPTVSFFEGEDPGATVIEIFATAPVDEAELKTFMGELSALAGHEIAAPRFEAIADKDWVSESQRLRQPVHAGRFTVCEAHQRAGIAASREVIVIEAGQAFGTGGHGSTKACLMALDAMAESISPENALDIGTGSGVLAIAMTRLWQIQVLASDIDPVATETAAKNFAVNEASGIETVTADGVADPAIMARAPFALITANILAGPLTGMATGMAGISAPGAALVLSGITREQAAAVQAAYVGAGFAATARVTLGDWSTLIFRRDA